MSKLFNWAAARIVAAFALALPLAAMAEIQKTNPVTGETENYTWKFVGTDTWNGTQYWQNSDSTPPVGVPAKSGDSSWGGSDDQWLPILFDGNTIQINAGMLVEGWNLRMGLYNGANITLQHLVKLQSGVATWFTVDENSTLTIAGMDNNKLEGSNPLCLYSARANGITWTPALSNSAIGTGVQMPIYYYLAGDGTVAFNGGITLTSAQVIKRADVTLSEATSSKTVRSKTLVSFASTSTSTFSADAETTIKVKNSDGTALKDVNLTSVTATDTTLTTAGNVGDCELVQTTTGVVLYYVDYAKTYKPSININFTNGAGNGLTTSADVGLDGYAVPGTSWNNFAVANNTTFNTVNAIDSTGAASVASGVSVSISGTRGHWNCSNLTPASNPLHGYIDESADGPTPTVTITGIPYEHYRVIVYHSTDQNGAKFGYDTINGFNFTYVDGVQTEGTTSWGSAGAANSAEPIGEGTNTLVSAVLSGDTVTMVAHRIGGGSPSARGCFAAIQVVEYAPEVGENDLEIAVEGATEYEVNEAKELSGTVYLTGSGTLTLTGSEKITAATIDVAKDVVLNINADRLDATTFTGAGTVVYDTTAPVEGKGWANIGWSGTVWIKNQSVSSFEGTKFGNAASTVRFTGVTGFLQTSSYNSSTYVHTVPLELVDEGNTVAFTYNNGWGGNLVKINTLKGTGTLYTEDKGSGEHIYIVDASGFSGVFNLTCKYVYVGGSQPDYSASTNPNGKLEIRSGVTMTVPSGKTWTANGGFVVNGTLNVDGTLASSHTTKAVSGNGTVVFSGRAPTVSGDAWWKNADWTGTVQVKDVTNMVGDSRAGVWLKFNDYGNSGSVVEMNNVTGWLETGYTCTPKIKITGTLYLNNGGSGKASAFKVGTLLGSGTISGDGSAVTVVFNITDDWSGFTGTIGLNNKCIVFGETIPDELTAGTIYISEGAVVTPQQSSGVWWGVGGIKVDGELRAPNLGKFGGGTTITTSDNGIFTLTDSNDTNDSGTDYARITGTGTLRYADVSGKWRALSKVNFPTNMICENNLSAGLILTTQGDNIIGSLAGSGQMRSDWGGSGNTGDRDLLILQARDTTYSGLFASSNDRVRDVYVNPGAATAGTLTLSGAQTASNDLAIESGAKVNLTGTWVGATMVAGTFGGTGTLTGDLTFSDGATFKAFGIDSDGLAVSGAVSYPETGTVTVDFAEVPTADTVLLTASDLDASKFTLAAGVPGGSLAVENNALVYKSPFVIITVPAIEHTAVEVTVDGVVVGPTLLGGTEYAATNGAAVVVTYSAASGYEVTGGTFEFTVSGPTTIDTTDVAVAQYVAKVRNLSTSEYDEYTTLAAAIAAADGTTHANSIMLIAGVTESEVTVSSAIVISGNYTINADVKVATGGQLQLMQAVLSGKLTIEDGGVYATNGGALDTVVAKDGAKIQLTTLSADTAPLTVTTLTVEGELMVVSSYASAERGTTYKALSYVTANATFETGAEIVGGGEWTNGAVVDGDNTVVTLAITAVARVGDVYYDDLADAIAAGGGVEVVDLMVAPAETIKLGAGETLKIKKYSFEVSVALADGLLTPPHYLEFETDSSTLVSTYTVKSYVAAIGDDKYESLAAAIEAATAGQTVTLLADDRVSFANIEVESGVPSNGSIVIDKNIAINGAGYTVYGNTDLSMKNITNNVQDPNQEAAVDRVDGSNVVGFFVKSGNVTFTNITFTEFGDTAYVNKFGYTPIQTASAYTGTLTLANVNFNKFNRTAVCVSGGTLAMTGGTIAGGTVNKNNGDYFQQPVEVRGGTATIDGVTITGGDDIVGGNGGGAIVAWGDTTVNNVNIDFVGYGIWADVADVAITGENTAISATTNSVFVEEGGSATIAAGDFSGSLAVDGDASSSIAVSGGTFDAVVPDEYLAEGYEVLDNGDGTYGVREDKGWIYAAPGYWNYTGTWSEGATLGEEKVTIEDGATYTASEASDGRFVTVAMTLSFDDANDDDDDFGDAKAAIRLASGETDGTYQFQLYTSDGANKVWTNATVVGVTATKEVDYNFVIVLDLTNKIYTASVVTDAGATTNALTIGENVTEIPFACQGEITPVQQIDFVGAGKVSSIEGSYETPEEPPAPEGFDEDDTIGEVTLTAEQATWLNAQNNYDVLAAKIETMDATAFNNAYLLNLDITGDFSYEFKVTDVEVGDTAVTVTVSLTRNGALAENEVAKPIVGTLKLKGTASLGTAFTVLGEAAVEFDANADFSDGATETTVTVDTSETDAKFYLPVIE